MGSQAPTVFVVSHSIAIYLLAELVKSKNSCGRPLVDKHWARIINNDSTLISAVLDRLLHHADTVIIEGKSYRMKDQIEAP